MSTYRNTRRDEAIANDFQANHMPCRVCGGSAPYVDLFEFGGQCGPCDVAYRAALNPSWWPNRPLTMPERREMVGKAQEALRHLRQPLSEPRAWADKLRDREARGEKLTIVQKTAWRTALRVDQSEAA